MLSPRNEADARIPDDQASIGGPRNHTDLFNAMIYPFTRTVVYGAIWYQGIDLFVSGLRHPFI